MGNKFPIATVAEVTLLSQRHWRRVRRAWAGGLLFVLPIPLLFDALFSLWRGDAGGFVASAGPFALFMTAAVLCRRGQQSAIVEEDRPLLARRSRRLKTAGGVITVIATVLAASLAAGHALPAALAFGAVAALGYFLLYREEEPVPTMSASGADVEAAAELLREAYARLDSLTAVGRAIPSAEFRQRLESIVTGADRILKLIAQEPGDARRARKFITVYLEGAQRVAEQYARAKPGDHSPERDHNFRTLLVDLENTCDEQYEKLQRRDMLDLDVQIEVLSARLRREGVI